MQAGRIAAAVLLPPLGAYLARGPGREFLISCGLTVLGFLPGVAFALWTVLRDERRVVAVA
ncbi:YqaE/Pmp3 family membrane protein [Sphingomonas sp. HF-S4]|uniref:YqaE/Pmp3 family membrane protein n=1 Tax=Sphingomonas agrestis TaxID=3080540 RepID=A0ABU3YC93_9SPHN|nr:YqaE/Pmp3 family membrane protein [Sphingomonas sp. HF-S4]MDV3459006.1 YqaE/Pmp3 family membrane protein [Sphingomonas sp. HF-S4]